MTKEEMIEKIEAIVCWNKKIDPKLLHEKNNHRDIVESRQIIMYLAKELSNISYAKIGIYFLLDRVTAYHAHKTINNLIETNRNKRKEIIGYKNKINAVKIEGVINKHVIELDNIENEYILIKQKILDYENTIKSLKKEYQSLGYNIITEINGDC